MRSGISKSSRKDKPYYRALGLLLVLAGAVIAARSAAGQWVPAGVPLCSAPNTDFSTDHLVIPDGAGGLFAAWRDGRDYPITNDDVYLQRLTGNGLVPSGWPVDGLGICVAERDQIVFRTAPDGQGGALVVWADHRGSSDVYVQRVNGDGSLAAGWPVNGAPACLARSGQWLAVVEPDGEGGAFVAWEDNRDYSTHLVDIYAQHLAADGAVATGWPADGLAIAVGPGVQGLPNLLSDGVGGVVVIWADNETETASPAVWGVRLRADGTVAPEWGTGNKLLISGRGGVVQMISDDAGGFYVTCSTESPTNPGFVGEHWVQRFGMDGEVAPGWPEQGLLVCQAPDARTTARVVADDRGGLLMTWYDYRLPGGVVYAARVHPSGALAPGWAANGTLLSDPTAPGVEYNPAIAPDGVGGAYVVWNVEYIGVPAFIQHLTATGQVAPGWPPFGVRVAPTRAQYHPQIVTDSKGGAIVLWDERTAPRLGLYAQRFQFDGPVPVLFSLASAVAEPGLVRLVWQGTDAAGVEFGIERRTDSNPAWTPIARLLADANGRVSYEDRAIEPGTRYAYRLRWREADEERTTSESWVDVPQAATLALEGLQPNPAVRDLDVAFTLAAPGPVRLEVLDLAGRQCLAHELGALGAGRHVARLGSATQVKPGVYWLRLTQGSEQRMTRGVVVR